MILTLQGRRKPKRSHTYSKGTKETKDMGAGKQWVMRGTETKRKEKSGRWKEEQTYL